MKLGRKPRLYNPRIPHYSAYVAGKRHLLAPPPDAVDFIAPLGNSFGMMLNDTLGDAMQALREVSQ